MEVIIWVFGAPCTLLFVDFVFSLFCWLKDGGLGMYVKDDIGVMGL